MYIKIWLGFGKWQFYKQEMGGYGGVIFSAQFPLRGKHPIQFRYVPAPGYEPEWDCNWQPLDSQLDLNIDETETWQRGLCSTFWFTSCYTDPFYCQINSVSGLQYVRAVQWCHSVLSPTWVSYQFKLMSTQKQTRNKASQQRGKKEAKSKQIYSNVTLFKPKTHTDGCIVVPNLQLSKSPLSCNYLTFTQSQSQRFSAGGIFLPMMGEGRKLRPTRMRTTAISIFSEQCLSRDQTKCRLPHQLVMWYYPKIWEKS